MKGVPSELQYSYHPIVLEAGIERLIRRDHWNQLRHEVTALSSQIDELASRDDYAIYARVLNSSATRAQTTALFDLTAQLDRFAASNSFADYTGGLGQSPHPFLYTNPSPTFHPPLLTSSSRSSLAPASKSRRTM